MINILYSFNQFSSSPYLFLANSASASASNLFCSSSSLSILFLSSSSFFSFNSFNASSTSSYSTGTLLILFIVGYIIIIFLRTPSPNSSKRGVV